MDEKLILKERKEIVKQNYLTISLRSCIVVKVSEMERIAEQAMLYDFYGELLTEHQKKIYEDVVNNDFSLTEIAQANGISRQGVHDLIRRCDKLLQDYEEKLHLVERFLKIRDEVEVLQKLAENDAVSREELAGKVKEISGQIVEEL